MNKETKIIWKPIDDLIPYEHNAKEHTEKQLANLEESFRRYGWQQPCLITNDNVIITGHGRIIGAKRAGLTDAPCIYCDDLSEKEIKEYRHLDNLLSDGDYIQSELEFELPELDFSDFDMGVFGFEAEPLDFDIELDELEDEYDGGYYGDERERTNRAYHLDILDPDNLTNDFWQMPIIQNNGYIPTDLIGFNYAKTSKNKDAGIHFYLDDYQFERVWNYPEKYIDVLLEYDCILSPDFSLYMDMPMPMKIWNVYRSRQIGAYYQSRGLNVIPTISWAEPATYDFCFQGIPKGSIVSISTIGVKRDKEALKIWTDGVTEMIKRIEPSTILIYGGALDYDYGNIKVIYFENKVTENWSG